MTKLTLLVLLAIVVAVIAGGRSKRNQDDQANVHEKVYYGDEANERGATKYDKARDMETKFMDKVNEVPDKYDEVGGRAENDIYGGTIEQQKYGEKDDKIKEYEGKYRKFADSVGGNYGYDKTIPVPPRVGEIDGFRDKYNGQYGDNQLDMDFIQKEEDYAKQFDHPERSYDHSRPFAGKKPVGKGYQNQDNLAKERGHDKLSEKENKASEIAGKYHRGSSKVVMNDYAGRVGPSKYLEKQNRAHAVAGKYHHGANSVGADVVDTEYGRYASRYSDREGKVNELEARFHGLSAEMKKQKKERDAQSKSDN